MHNSGGVQRTQQRQSKPSSGRKARLVLDDGMSKAMSVGDDRTLSLEEKMLLEKELCPLQAGTGVVIALPCGSRHQELATDAPDMESQPSEPSRWSGTCRLRLS